MWKSCGAVSFNKVMHDLNFKVPYVDGHLCSINNGVLRNGRINYVVSEYKIMINEIASNVVFASHWAKSLVKFTREPKVVEVVHHEVPSRSTVAYPMSFITPYAFFVSDVQPRKNPDLWEVVIPKLKFKVLAVTKPEMCRKLERFPNFKCVGTFGNVYDTTLNSYIANARLFLWFSGGEGFGLPPLEASFYGKYPVAMDIPPFNEWFPKDLKVYTVKPIGTKVSHGFIANAPYVHYRFDPDEFAEVSNQAFYDEKLISIGRDLSVYVRENYTRGRQYERFYDIWAKVRVVEKEVVQQ